MVTKHAIFLKKQLFYNMLYDEYHLIHRVNLKILQRLRILAGKMLQLKGKNIFLFSTLLLLGLCTFFFWWYFLSSEKALEVDFESGGTIKETAGSPALIFAVAPVISPERNIEDYQELAGYLARELNQPVRIIQRKTYHEINELIRIGKVNLAIICTGAYLHAKSSNIPLEIISVPVFHGEKSYHSLVIVRSDSPVKSVMELKGRSFAFSDPLSLTGYFYPLFFLLNNGFSPEKFFSSTMFTYSHDGSINVVLDKITDAAAVNDLVYNFEIKHRPELKKKLKVIHQSGPLGINPIVMSSSGDSLLRKRVQKIFLEMQDKPVGKQLLDKLGIEKFEIPRPSIYDSADTLYYVVNNFLEGKNKSLVR